MKGERRDRPRADRAKPQGYFWGIAKTRRPVRTAVALPMGIGLPRGSPLAGHTYAIVHRSSSAAPRAGTSSPARRRPGCAPTAHRRVAHGIRRRRLPVEHPHRHVVRRRIRYSLRAATLTRRTAYWCLRTVAVAARVAHVPQLHRLVHAAGGDDAVVVLVPVAAQDLVLVRGDGERQCGCRTSQIFRVQSPDAVANTSVAAATTPPRTRSTQAANVRSDPGAFGFVADGGA